jgi:hypothetical protein
MSANLTIRSLGVILEADPLLSLSRERLKRRFGFNLGNH